MSNVINLLDHASVSCGDVPQLADWMREWADALESGDYGDIRSIAFVVETKEGEIATLSQSIGGMDAARLCGLLTIAAAQKAHGGASIRELWERYSEDGV